MDKKAWWAPRIAFATILTLCLDLPAPNSIVCPSPFLSLSLLPKVSLSKNSEFGVTVSPWPGLPPSRTQGSGYIGATRDGRWNIRGARMHCTASSRCVSRLVTSLALPWRSHHTKACPEDAQTWDSYRKNTPRHLDWMLLLTRMVLSELSPHTPFSPSSAYPEEREIAHRGSNKTPQNG